MKRVLLIFISISFLVIFQGQLFAEIQADAYINKKRIYIFQTLNLTIKITGDYDSVASAGYLDETLLNDFEIKNTSVSTRSFYSNSNSIYSRIMRYELTPIRDGKAVVPSISILYENNDGDGYITTDSMAVKVYGKGFFVFHIILYAIGFIIVAFSVVMIILGIRSAKNNV